MSDINIIKQRCFVISLHGAEIVLPFNKDGFGLVELISNLDCYDSRWSDHMETDRLYFKVGKPMVQVRECEIFDNGSDRNQYEAVADFLNELRLQHELEKEAA